MHFAPNTSDTQSELIYFFTTFQNINFQSLLTFTPNKHGIFNGIL